MGINKKAFFFTTIAIALSIVIILSYNIYTSYKSEDKINVVETRISTMNNFIIDLESDIENAIFIVGFRSLLGIEDYMMANDNFINNLGTNLNTAFDEVFRQGTINSQKMAVMENSTFPNWTQKMKEQAIKTDVELGFTVNGVTISQASPWLVGVSVDLTINVDDKKNIASWTINKIYTKNINITGFVDPLYLVNNDGRVNNSIRKTTVSNFATSLPTHALNSYYIEHTDAPSYLMRFENNLGSSPYGIESLVNSQKLIDKGIPTRDRSAVDFIYYGTSVTTNCRVISMESYTWFKLDSSHLGFYSAVCVS